MCWCARVSPPAWTSHTITWIFLSNVRSLCNKLQLLVGKNRKFSSSAFCFTESWQTSNSSEPIGYCNCKPFYSPREFASFILIAGQLAGGTVQAHWPDIECWADNPDSLVIVLSDFSKGNLSHELPKYTHIIKCLTREEYTLDHCYSTVSRAYHTVPCTALGHWPCHGTPDSCIQACERSCFKGHRSSGPVRPWKIFRCA